MPKATTPTSGGKRRHNPLEQDYVAAGPLKRPKAPKRGKEEKEKSDFVDDQASRKILQISRELLEEERAELGSSRQAEQPKNAFGLDDVILDQQDDDEDEEVFDDEWSNEGELEEAQVEDLETFNKFLGSIDDDPLLKHGWDRTPAGEQEQQETNLADLILAKIEVFESGQQEEEAMEDDYEIPEKVVEVYSKCGMILSHYRSGPLPKPIKMLPTIPSWENILELTKPEEWTPNAIYAVTRVFTPAKPAVMQRFIEMVLLDKVRDEIRETGQLKNKGVHLKRAMEKSLYRPSAFFKGFLFPLVSSGTCSLKEARIVAAVLRDKKIPLLHSAVAIEKLCQMAAEQTSSLGSEAAGATNIFIKTFLEKRYALPFRVVDSLVFHFLRFRAVDPASVKEGDIDAMDVSEERAVKLKLPVIWHQCLLAFATHYKNDITEDQREALLDLLLTHGHHQIGPEVRKELLAGRGRGMPMPQQAPTFDGDDTMVEG